MIASYFTNESITMSKTLKKLPAIVLILNAGKYSEETSKGWNASACDLRLSTVQVPSSHYS
jgi:hypothetical protein